MGAECVMIGVLLLSCRMAWLPTYTTRELMHDTLYVMPVCAAWRKTKTVVKTRRAHA